MSRLPNIIRLLPLLSDAELAELGARIKALQSTGHAVVSDGDVQSDELFVLGCISDTLRAHGADLSAVHVMQRAAAARVADGSSFRDKVPAVLAFLRHAHSKRTGQHALLLLALQLLLLDLRKQGIPVSHRTLMAQIHRIGAVLDAHFPGYYQAGLLGRVLEPRIVKSAAE